MDLVGAKQQTEKEKIVKFNRILVDTGFLLGIFDRTDQYHKSSIAALQALRDRRTQLVLTWPVLYETVNTAFVEDSHLSDFKRLLHQYNTTFIDDKPYREYLRKFILNDEESNGEKPDEKLKGSNFSLVDQILYLMMKHSDDVKIGGLASFDGVLKHWAFSRKLAVFCEETAEFTW